jgi:hypothetical protein
VSGDGAARRHALPALLLLLGRRLGGPVVVGVVVALPVLAPSSSSSARGDLVVGLLQGRSPARRALLLKLKVPLHALRTTCVLCWLALDGAEQTALHAGVSKVPSPNQVQCSVSRAEAECFFGLTPD